MPSALPFVKTIIHRSDEVNGRPLHRLGDGLGIIGGEPRPYLVPAPQRVSSVSAYYRCREVTGSPLTTDQLAHALTGPAGPFGKLSSGQPLVFVLHSDDSSKAVPPAASTSLAATSSPVIPRASSATFAPRWANCRTTARPTPALAPVTTTTWSVHCTGVSWVTSMRWAGAFEALTTGISGGCPSTLGEVP
jgi:hypothetical protein